MSIECSECESDARAGHDPECSRSAENEVKRLRTALIEIDDLLSHPGVTQSATIAMVRRYANNALGKH